MGKIALCTIVISVLLLLGFVFHSYLSKIPKNGKTIIKWKIALNKILQIEFESEHDSNYKDDTTIHN